MKHPAPRRRKADVNESRSSVPAIVTYWLLGIWTGIVGGVFALVGFGVSIDGILLSMVSGIIGTQTTLLVAAVSFWVGATMGGKQANERLSEASKMSSAALEKIAAAPSVTPAPGTASVVAAADVNVEVTKTEEPQP